MLIHVRSWFFVISFLYIINGYADNVTDAAYCNNMGGVVHTMSMQYNTQSGVVRGLSSDFCHFKVDSGSIDVGLETYASSFSNIAASYMKILQPLPEEYYKGQYANPSHNVCNKLHGVMASFVYTGFFTSDEGQSDICVFGDGSMISAWSLIYMANHREGYDEIKNNAQSTPLPLILP